MVSFCVNCVMPDSRPGVVLDDRGVCSACRHSEYKRNVVDWQDRHKQFKKLCEKYKKQKNEYDCVVSVSGGKDSYYQVGTMIEHGLKPLLANVDNIGWSTTGRLNFENLLDVTGCDCLTLKSPESLHVKLGRIALEERGFAFWLFDRQIYSYPLRVAVDMNIPFVIYGENPSVEYGGFNTVETPVMYHDTKDAVSSEKERTPEFCFWDSHGIDIDSIKSACIPYKEIKKGLIDCRYLSYYFNWSGHNHLLYAKEMGFRDLWDTREWVREGYVEQYDQIDSVPYLMEAWLRFPKFGFNRATDVSCYLIRDGLLGRLKACQLVREKDHKVDPRALHEFLKLFGYTREEFFGIVDKFWNRDLFKKEGDGWILKNPVWM